MADEKYTFETARVRLEEIATEVRKKDTSLEKSLDLLEEGVRLANICTELVDRTDANAAIVVPGDRSGDADEDAQGLPEAHPDEVGEDADERSDTRSGDGLEESDEDANGLPDVASGD